MGKLVDGAIPTLFGGVSQQPVTVRRPNQLEVSTNALSSVVTGGFEKRPPTEHIAALAGLDNTLDYAVHGIDRDPTVQDFILLTEGSIHAYNAITGATKTVTIGDTKHYFMVEQIDLDSIAVVTFDWNALAYKQMGIATGETTFDWGWQLSDATTGRFKIEGSADNVTWNDIATGKGGGASGTFSTTIDAAATGDHNYIRVSITTAMATAADTMTLWATFQDTTYLLGTDGPEDFAFVSIADHTFIVNRTLKTRLREADSGTITSTHESLTALQTADAPTGDATIHRITGEDDSGFAGFFVKDDATFNEYVETVDPTAHNGFAASTMPHSLVRGTDGNFTFAEAVWKDRASGDETVNPAPKFIDKAIADIGFWSNRMALVADDNTYLGEAADVLDLWAQKATQVLDTDPIDRAAVTTKVTLLQWLAVFRKKLFVTAENAQFELTGGTTGLTPDNASLDLSTTYKASLNCKPVTSGDVLYLASKTAVAASVFEYFFDDGSLNNKAADVTKHIGTYIPLEIIKIASDPTSGSTFFLSTGEQNSLFVYRTFFDGDSKIQSAWSKYTFGATEAAAFIHGFDIMSGYVVLVIERDDGNIYLEQMSLEREVADPVVLYTPFIDQRDAITGVYDTTHDLTTWTTEWDNPDEDTVVVLGALNAEPGRRPTLTAVDKYTLTLATVTAGKTLVVNGLTYTAHATTTTVANREFSIAGATDTLDADELVTCLMDPTYGVPNVTSINSAGVITMTVEDQIDDTITISNAGAGNTIVVFKSNDVVAARTNLSAGAAYVGRPYTMTGEISKIFMREAGSSAGVGPAILNGRLQLRDMTFFHEDTGYYFVQVTPKYRDAVQYPMTGRILGDGNNLVGQPAIVDEGKHKVPILSNALTVKVEIINDSPLPSVITGATWRGFFNELSRQE